MDYKVALEKLNEISAKMKALTHAMGLLHWDLETEAPELAVENISNTLAILTKENYNLIVSEETIEIIKTLEKADEKLSDLEKAVVKEFRKEYDKIMKIPVDEYSEYSKAVTIAQMEWQKAKAENDFEKFAPHLEKLIEYNKRFVKYRGHEDHPYNTLLDDYRTQLLF